MRPIPRRLLPDDMLVWPDMGDGTLGEVRIVRHVRMEWAQDAASDAHRSAEGCHGTVIVDAANSSGAFEIPVGSKVLMGAGPSARVARTRRCCVVRGHVHHWELDVR